MESTLNCSTEQWIRGRLKDLDPTRRADVAGLFSISVLSDQEKLRNEMTWEEKLDEVLAFQSDRGRLPRSRVEGETQMYGWLTTQRSLARGGKLKAEHVALLQQHGLAGSSAVRTRTSTEDRLKQVEAFIVEHGRAPRRNRRDEAENDLGQWLAVFRQSFSKGRLSENSLNLVEKAYPMVLEGLRPAKPKDFNYYLNQAAAYFASTDRWPLATGSTIGERSTATWVYRLSIDIEAGKVPEHELEALRILPAHVLHRIYNPRRSGAATPWEDRLQQLVEHLRGSGKLPRQNKTGVLTAEGSLHSWCKLQRRRYREGKLSAEQLALLQEKVPMFAATFNETNA